MTFIFYFIEPYSFEELTAAINKFTLNDGAEKRKYQVQDVGLK